LVFSFKHPFYLSVTDLNYSSASNKGLYGSVRLTINDLEETLGKLNHQTVDLINIKDSLATKQLLQNYLKPRLKISLDQRNVDYSCIGFEKEQDAIWLYIECANCKKPSHIKIENTLLYDYLKEQTNIVHFDLDGVTKSSKVKFPDKWMEFVF